MDEQVAQKILKYETFLNEHLREDLKIIQERLNKVNENLATWCLLKKSLADMDQYHPRGFKTKTDIGCGLLMKVNVPDPSVIKMHIGLNVYLDMTLEDGVKYCVSRISLLEKELKHLQTQANQVKAHIKLILLGLNELQKC